MTTRTRMLVAALALALLLAGCSSGGTRDDGRITLRFQSLAWQQESVEATKELVAEWNAAHPDVRVEYVQGSWDSVHDQLLTSFEGGAAPTSSTTPPTTSPTSPTGATWPTSRTCCPSGSGSDIPPLAWRSVTFGDGVYGVPFLQEPRVLIAGTARLRESGVRVPTPAHPWSWAEFQQVTEKLSGDGRYGVAWPLKEPVSATLNLSLSAGGRLFHRDADGKVTVRFEDGDEVVPRTIHEQVNSDRSASPTTLGSGGSDTLPGLFAGKYAMVPLGFSYRQQIVQQAPEGFDWQVLPAPAGAGGLAQGVSPQTLSVAEDCPHKKEAVAFLDFLLQPRNMVRLARSATGCCPPAARPSPTPRCAPPSTAGPPAPPSPPTSARPPPSPYGGYPEWKDKVATPALQEYYSGAIGLGELRARLEDDGNLVLARYQR